MGFFPSFSRVFLRSTPCTVTAPGNRCTASSSDSAELRGKVGGWSAEESQVRQEEPKTHMHACAIMPMCMLIHTYTHTHRNHNLLHVTHVQPTPSNTESFTHPASYDNRRQKGNCPDATQDISVLNHTLIDPRIGSFSF